MGQQIVGTLGIALEMATGGAVDDLNRFGGVVDKVTAQAVREIDRIDAAMKNVGGLDAATASAVKLAEATARTAIEMARDADRSERNGERIVSQLERQIAVYGLTRAEVRALRAEEAARAAADNNQFELAGRIRAREAELYAMELATARKARAEADAAAQDAVVAADKAARAKEQEAQAVREAGNAYQMFEARVRAGAAAMREEAAAAEAAARRHAARGPAMFEAYASQKWGEDRDRQSAQAAADAERAASALRAEAAAAEEAARAHKVLAAAVQGSHTAQVADAEAAERLRMSTDPLYASTKRLNAEIAESTRLYHAGATAPAEYARQQDILAGRLRAVGQGVHDTDENIRRGRGSMTQLSFQVNDIVTMASMGAKPMQIFASQAGQIVQVAQMAEGGVKGFARELGAVTLAILPFAAAAAVAGVATYRWMDQLDKDAGLKKYADGLGLTHKEMKKLGDQSITTGDLVSGLWKTISDGAGLGGTGKSIMEHLFSPDDARQVQGFVASIYGFFAGGYDAIVTLWGSLSSTVSGYISAIAGAASRFFAPVVAAAQWAGNAVGQIFNAVYQWVAGWFKSISGVLAPVLSAIGQGPAATAVASAGTSLGKTFGDAYSTRVAGFVAGTNAFVDRVGENATVKAQERLRAKADEIIANRTAKKPPVDRHAEQLAREAEAIEAQIRNLYKLADAYGVSGASALIAEARVKAESKAIKQRADIEAAVSREIQLAVAQRVSDAEKATAGVRSQAAAQAEANAMVAAGIIPAERAAEMVKDRIADLTLLDAIEAARAIKGRTGIDAVERATKAYNAQKLARADLRAGEAVAMSLLDQSAAERQLELLDAELRLIGATEAARVHEIATIKAWQEAKAKYQDPALQAAYVKGQVAVADAGERNRQMTDAWNESLSYTADLFDEIDRSAQRSAQGMADAFGSVGAAIGDAMTVMTSYYVDQASLQQAHEAALRRAGTDQRRIDQESRLFAIRSSTAQIGAYGDMASAAKGFFKEGSDGYKAIAAAEKVYRVAQMAMSLQAMIQNALETTTSVANAGARATADGTAGIAAQAKLPFPANIAAMAATGAALVAAGIAIFGGLGGKNTLPESNTGIGTVLGDSSAQSESVRRGIDQLKEVDVLMLNASRQMASHLRSIDNQIGGFAAQIVRSGNVDASGGVDEGFKKNLVGSILGSIPVIGGLLGGLFGTKTSVVGSGLYGGAQTVGSILDGGFDASTYSDVEKKKKLFGITTSTKRSTQYSDADAALENQFTLILRGFASAIGAAAEPLGQATDAVQARLNGFVVNIGKIDLQGLTGAEIEEKLEAIFGAAADGMAEAVYPGLQRFQKAGEGAFETMVRVASTVEAVTASFEMMGRGGIGIDASMALAGLFDNLSDLTNAQQGYFEAYYTDAEQAAARLAQVQGAVGSLGLKLPDTLAGFRALVEAQDLTSAAGRETYATLIQLAPAFADLQAAMGGAKSAADFAAERQDLERKLLELNGDQAAIRALDLAKLDASNRGLQQQVWAAEAAKEAAAKAEELRKAWSSVGDGIMDEVRRIRGTTDAQGPAGFSALMGQFNAVTAAARAGDMDAAKQLPALSRSLLDAAAKAATSRQELDRVQAEAAASLEATYAAVAGMGGNDTVSDTATRTAEAMAEAAAAATTAVSATSSLVAEVRQLRDELVALRTENRDGHAKTATEAGRSGKVLERVVGAAGGDALGTRAA